MFVWLHHPPDADVPLTNDPVYAAEWEAVIPDRPKIRGFGSTHAFNFPGRGALGLFQAGDGEP